MPAVLDNSDSVVTIPSPTLDMALSAARQRFSARLSTSAAIHRQAVEVMPGGNTRTVLHHEPFPIVMTGGKGASLLDADGNTYVDFLGEYSAGIYGHSNPQIRDAIVGALDKGLGLSAHNDLEPQLARLIVDRIPSIELVRFTNSGTEANLLALSLARAATGRSTVIAFRGAYHGSILTFVSEGAPLNAPYRFVVGRFNDEFGAAALIEAHRDELAAVVVEPMLGAGGCIPGDLSFLRAIENGCRRAGALFILDEVMTSRLSGAGRQGQLELRPDLTTLGKYIGGGSSFGAFGGRRDLMAAFDPRYAGGLAHAGTFNNNVITMAAAIAGLSRLYTPAAAERLNMQGDQLRSALNATCFHARVPMRFTGLGSLMNAHGTDRPIARFEDLAVADRRIVDLLFLHLLECGYYIAPRGFVTLHLEIDEHHTAGLIEAVSLFCERYGSALRS
ncbi:aminotransferase class III-fold pyridoxal phosphate-dependent enzyme [Sphingomonas sp. BK580]|uniref:aminotransferase class III-fold pyridoxal phosphate-dependent enzyme n=1 Tax=Sphingomonas sp. BK580 TaxID=2586972 RepID=UPI0016073003|nr:aminotransferase class III-fold pyridoxal phosphate-dependent enzyme [Sphingomonas sp. BK580]MBB3694646.1 glutamate-1-semialdehyde 2,1-aminomutase [Sphingomonas sp. BK580]